MLLFGGGGGGGVGNGGSTTTRLALTDFGTTAAYNVDVGQYHWGGTLRYMAPVQWRQLRPQTPGCDMWAAGIVLSQLFAGDSTRRAVDRYWTHLHLARNANKGG